jgi:hypothetical protein
MEDRKRDAGRVWWQVDELMILRLVVVEDVGRKRTTSIVGFRVGVG